MASNVILVFGTTGQVATELQAQASVTALGRAQADLSDPAACAAAIQAHAPAVVINAAAWTDVDGAEAHEAEAHVINAEAPGAMAQACAALDIPFLHISTDYVFDGSGTDAWSEDNKTNPQNAYGRTKLAGEEAVRAAGGRHAILRTAWVFSAHGKNFVKTMLYLSQTRDALNVVEDQHGGPTSAADIAAALLVMAKALRGGQAGGTYHYAGSPHTSWAGFAREIFAQADRDVAVTGIPSSGFPTPAPRPLNSRLACARIEAEFGIPAPDWTVGLANILKTLKETS
ncbi:MAG: dTDP-4-dehydrorhamnose reductase [Roseovarius sp.]